MYAPTPCQPITRVGQWIATVAKRVGVGDDVVRLSVVRLLDDELERLAAKRDVRTMDQLREYVEQCRAPRKPRPSSSPEVPFFQRWIVGIETFRDRITGELLVSHWKLSCGHRVPTKKRVPASTKSKTTACADCGSGTRTPFDRRRNEEQRSEMFERAWCDQGSAPEWRKLVDACTSLATMAPLDKRREKVREDALSSLKALGLLDAE
jgi:hypothetical protein